MGLGCRRKRPVGADTLAGEEASITQCLFRRVKVITNKGETAWSSTGHWSMAILDHAEWQAQWIGEDSLSNPEETVKENTRLAARYLRKPFTTGSSQNGPHSTFRVLVATKPT